MARTKGAKNRRTKEFDALYDQYKDRYGCPVEALFVIMNDPNGKEAYRLQASQTLIKYKYAVPKVEEKQQQTAFTFTWDDAPKRANDRIN